MTGVIVMLGLFGAAMFYGDSAITPAISVLSAVEGLEVISPQFKALVIPLTLLVLIGLFAYGLRGSPCRQRVRSICCSFVVLGV
jgi:KUP system potassium uptake protein